MSTKNNKIEIDLPFKPGETVYYIPPYKSIIKKSKIHEIGYIVSLGTKRKTIRINYIKTAKEHLHIDGIYKTKEALIEDLIKNIS